MLRRLAYACGAFSSYRGQRVFGESKTWRGVAVAIAGCVLGTAVQRHWVGSRADWLAVVDYSRLNVWTFGLAMGAGAMLGELPNSFVKRRLGIAPGHTARGALRVLFYAWDQVDVLTTSWPLLTLWFRPSVALVLTSFSIALILHPLSSLIGFLIGARKSAR